MANNVEHEVSSDQENITPNETNLDLSNPDVTTKYRAAGDIVNIALQKAMEISQTDIDIYEICKTIDKLIIDETSKVYNKKEKGKKIEKGVAFPTCISINEICGHVSPYNKESSRTLQEGDLIKIDLGCHIDGYVCVGGQSKIIQLKENEINGKKADVLYATWIAAEAVLRTVKIGNKSSQITKIIEKIAKEFNCNPVHGVLSHQMKRHVIEGNKCIPGSLTASEEKPEEFEFQLNEVYGIDIVFSTGEGKPKELDTKTTIYKRAVENKYILKSQLGRHFMSEVETKFPTLPFTLRALEDERAYKVGVPEAMRHDLLRPYHVYTEKPGEFVAQLKFTLLILPSGTKKITGFPNPQANLIKSKIELKDEEIISLLATSTINKKNKKKIKNQTENENSKIEIKN